jgi:UDP-hydrolysing UDP-N-acetyl-D-glucosamine 2-epimerase
MKRKICIITSNRAEFGQLKKLVQLIKRSKKSQLQLVVTGSHLEKKYGYTIKEIENNNIKITSKIKLNFKNKNKFYQIRLFNDFFRKITQVLIKLKPNIVLVLGDRFEILSVAQSCFFLEIPLAHLHGGEITEGVIDDTIRHLVTKMADLHFVANRIFRNRVLRLGEASENVYNFGSLTAEQAYNLILFKKEYLENRFKFKFRKRNILICLHPVRSLPENKRIINSVKKILEKFNDVFFIFTSPNFDEHAELFQNFIKNSLKKNKNCHYVKSFGYENFLSTLKHVDCIMGNSSSGITEAPILKVPTINIGNRQAGRPFSKSIINANSNYESILSAVNKIYSKNKNKNFKSYYYKKNTSKNILQILENKNLKNIKNKFFNDFAR